MVVVYQLHAVGGDLAIARDQVFDRKISAKAMRLHLILRALADNPSWEFLTSGLAKITGWKSDTVGHYLRELERAGYLERHAKQDRAGHFAGWSWTIYGVQRAEMIRREAGLPKAARAAHDGLGDLTEHRPDAGPLSRNKGKRKEHR